tara:strand:+ start:3483 stop:4751 length:1269 start_codon:yes stop_codon:yes gene_type:complete
MTAKKSVRALPKLRFPEFANEPPWECPTLGKLAKRVTTRNSDGAELRALTNSAEHGVIDQKDFFDKVIAVKTDNYFVVEKGDYVYNPRVSATAPVGPISKNQIGRGVMSPLYTVFRFKSESNDYFAHYFKASNWHEYLRRVSNSGARHDRMAISNDDFMKMPVPTPKAREQQRIVDCLDSLDELLSAERSKFETLQRYKQALMTVLFPAPGESLPTLRHPEFRDAGDWKPSRLGKLVRFRSGGTPSKSNPSLWNGSIPWVSAKDMKRMYLADTEDHITQEAVEGGTKLVPAGTVLMLTRGMTLRNDVPICILRREMSFNQDVKALLPNAEVHRLFLAYLLQANKQRLLVLVDIAGHGTGRLNTDELEDLELAFPKLDEQKRIASCLSTLDEIQAMQLQKVNELEAHKIGLLQNLFPSFQGEK